MMNEVKTDDRTETAILEQLEHLAGETMVFASLPLIHGITPRILIDKGRKEEGTNDDPNGTRYSGIFRPDEIGIPVFDHGLLYGDAVFEGVLIHDQRLFQWREHVQRLYASADRLRIPIPYDQRTLTERIQETVRHLSHRRGSATYLRLVVTRGIGDLGIQPVKCAGSIVYCIASKIQLYPESLYDTGIKMAVCRNTRRTSANILDPQIKACNYLNNILAWIEAGDIGTHEVLMLAQNGCVAEATTDNLFVVTKTAGWEVDPSKVMITTPARTACLKGITRSLVLKYAHRLGFQSSENAAILPTDLLGADKEVFLTGTAAGLISVVALEDKPIGDGVPGPVAQMLRRLLTKDLENAEMGLSLYSTGPDIDVYLASGRGSHDSKSRMTPEFVLRMFEVIDCREWARLEEFFGRNMTYERPGYAPLVGYDRVQRFYREERVIASGRHLLDEIVMDADGGACWGRFVGEHVNGEHIDERFADIYKFKGGKIQTRRSYFFRPAI